MARYRFTAKDGTEVAFREPRATDAERFMKFINEFVDEPRSGIPINKPVRLAEEKKWVRGRLSEIRSRMTVMLTVELDGEIVGNCDVKRRIWKQSHRGMVGIALSKKIRGKGIGEALMLRTIELARERMPGLEMLDLSVLAYNKRAKGLYKKLGFVRVGRVPAALKEGSRYVDEELMIKWL